MKTDKQTRVLLAIVALALCVIALNPWLRPTPVAAKTIEQGFVQVQNLGFIERYLREIAKGKCENPKLCEE